MMRKRYCKPAKLKMVYKLPTPDIEPDEILIKIHYSSVNRTDCGFLLGKPWIARLFSGLFSPSAKTLGCEFSGEVVQVGMDCKKFKRGDRIVGFEDKYMGGHAEYLKINKNKMLSKIPENISYRVGAALLEGAHYALYYVRASNIKPGTRVLVNGGTGGIGSSAIQLYKYFGAYVVATAPTDYVQTVKDLGADEVIDFQKEDFTKLNAKFDVVMDSVGKSSYWKCRNIMTKKAIYTSSELGFLSQNPLLAIISPFSFGRKVKFPIPLMKAEDASFLVELAANGQFKPLIEREYPLEEVQAAFEHVLTGQKIGNVLIRVI